MSNKNVNSARLPQSGQTATAAHTAEENKEDRYVSDYILLFGSQAFGWCQTCHFPSLVSPRKTLLRLLSIASFGPPQRLTILLPNTRERMRPVPPG